MCLHFIPFLEEIVVPRDSFLQLCPFVDYYLMDAASLMDAQLDRVLADVPCTTDRVSYNENENNIFTSRRSGEQNMLPEMQMIILM